MMGDLFIGFIFGAGFAFATVNYMETGCAQIMVLFGCEPEVTQ